MKGVVILWCMWWLISEVVNTTDKIIPTPIYTSGIQAGVSEDMLGVRTLKKLLI
jgi:hypothetical protein